MRIAVASKTGAEVDQHFGHAERFLVYDCDGGDPRRIGEVSVEKYCLFDPEQLSMNHRMDGIVAALQGCRAVLTAMIGELPSQQLQKAGIASFVAEGSIDEAVLHAYAKLRDAAGA